MHRLTRPIFLSIAIQAICVGIGFWFQYQLVVSTTEHEATEMAWSELTAQSGQEIGIVQKLAETSMDWTTFTKIIPQVSLDDDPSQPAILLTDSEGSILGFTKSASPCRWRQGERVIWKCDRNSVSHDGPQFGRVVTVLGERTAILYSLKQHDRQVIAYATMPTAPLWKKSLQASLALASGLGFFWTLSLTAVATSLISSRFHFREKQKQADVDHDALRNVQDLLRTRDAVIFGLAKLAESRDPETGHHLERISLYATRLATALRSHPKYHRIVTPTFVRLLGISSVLHDIGKVGVEDTVLLKPGKLTESEHLRMQQHTLVAGDCLKEIEERLGASNFLQTAREIALHHHERWDGKGYPYGLAGDAVPLPARIVSIADVYDALRSKRVYKEAMPHEECVKAIREGAGTQFDPELVEVFLEISSEFEAISRRLTGASIDAAMRNAKDDVASEGEELSRPDSSKTELVVGKQEHCDTSHRNASVA